MGIRVGGEEGLFFCFWVSSVLCCGLIYWYWFLVNFEYGFVIIIDSVFDKVVGLC